MDKLFEFMFLVGTLLSLGIMLRRLRQVETELRERRDRERATAAAPVEAESSLKLEGETRALLVSSLTVILGQCELARGQARPDARLLHVIERQARRLWELLERNPAPVPRTALDERVIEPAACARAAVDTHAGLALERDVNVHLMLDPTPKVFANASLLSKALRQLVRAAIVSAPPGRGDVTVAVGLLPAAGEATHVGFAVADDGAGYDPLDLAQILEPPPGREADPGSPEFAYALVRALARTMGAGFVMDSAPGAGTRATLKVALEPATTPMIAATPIAVSGPRPVPRTDV